MITDDEIEGALWHGCSSGTSTPPLVRDVLVKLCTEVRRLRALINVPGTENFLNDVRNEAAHQIERWGVEHDAGKRPEDWIALLVYLLGKATKAHFEGDIEKLKHHTVSTAAALLNWHRAITGTNNAMRPGVGP